MEAVNALEIWTELKNLPDCKEAVDRLNALGLSKEDVLDHGSADFDKPLGGQEAKHNVYYYISQDGYMDMHLQQNIEAFKTCLEPTLFQNRDVLFVDFGCGPMTAGLALADVVTHTSNVADYKERIAYLGIDISKNMCAVARRIHGIYDLYSCFKIVEADGFDPQIIETLKCSYTTAILNLSYVLSPRTYKHSNQESEAKKLAQNWHNFVAGHAGFQHTRIIYHNPDMDYSHQNWEEFCAILQQEPTQGGDMRYTIGNIENCNWSDSHRPSSMAQIKGQRR